MGNRSKIRGFVAGAAGMDPSVARRLAEHRFRNHSTKPTPEITVAPQEKLREIILEIKPEKEPEQLNLNLPRRRRASPIVLIRDGVDVYVALVEKRTGRSAEESVKNGQGIDIRTAKQAFWEEPNALVIRELAGPLIEDHVERHIQDDSIHNKLGRSWLSDNNAVQMYASLIGTGAFAYVTDTSILGQPGWITALRTGREKLESVWAAACQQTGTPPDTRLDYILNPSIQGAYWPNKGLFRPYTLRRSNTILGPSGGVMVPSKYLYQSPNQTIAIGNWDLNDLFNLPYQTGAVQSTVTTQDLLRPKSIIIGNCALIYLPNQNSIKITFLWTEAYLNLDSQGKVVTIEYFSKSHNPKYAIKCLFDELQQSGFMRQQFIDSLGL
ncbi:MAG: hypothetical protein V1492_02475 [Candidatus Micrarchaeota archaeon]